MRKKIISVLLIALLLLSSMVLAACKKNADTDAVAEEEVESVDIDDLIGRMNSALDVMNAIYPIYTRSVAAGYAYSHECPEKSSHEVYLLADKRMYENKKIMHEKLGIDARL